MIFNIPGQTMHIWQRDLKIIVELEPEHISAYSLTVEQGTVLNQLVQQNKFAIPNDDYSAELYTRTQEYLSSAGYTQYEISNWAKPGKECRQNLHYWQIDPYLAFGPSAHGFDGKNRFNNARNLDQYLQFLESGKLPIESHYPVSEKEMTNDLIGFGLRTNKGIQLDRIQKNYVINIPEKWASYLKTESGRLKLSEEGFIFADAIAVDLMID
jgi:oxygen-independent coproporphyrinogen-3 oxidase